MGVPRARGERCTSWNERSTWPVLTRAYRAVCLLLRHFIHVTDNFCHLFCPFSQVVPWSSPAAPDFLSLLSSHLSPLCSALFSLCSPLSSPSFSLSSCVVGSPRLSPVFCPIVCSLSFPHVPLLSPLFLPPCCPSSLFSPRSPLLAQLCLLLIVLVSTTDFLKKSNVKLTLVLRSGPAGLTPASAQAARPQTTRCAVRGARLLRRRQRQQDSGGMQGGSRST